MTRSHHSTDGTDVSHPPSERRLKGAAGEDVDVVMVSTPGDGSCGIGTYTRDVINAFDDTDAEFLEISQENKTVREFLTLALRAVRRDSDVIHIQHEYGLFRRPGSRYPGVLGLVFFGLLGVFDVIQRTHVVTTMHSVLRPAPSEAPFAVRLYLQCMHKLIATVSDHVVFLSRECERSFLRDVDLNASEYSFFPHGVNTQQAADVPQATAKERFGYDPDQPVVAIPGFMRPPKGHDIFIEVAERLPEVEFLVAGGARPQGEDFDFAEEIAATAPENVTITGVLDDDEFPVALAAPDLALLPYRVVSQSGTFNWCAAQELPVLASDEPYFERIEREWGALKTVSLDDPDDIAAEVDRLLRDRTELAALRANVRQYKTGNSFESVASRHTDLYRRLRGQAEADESTAEIEPASPRPMRAACSAQREQSVSPGD